MCSRTGRSPIGTSGFGITVVYGRSRVPRPPARTIALISLPTLPPRIGRAQACARVRNAHPHNYAKRGLLADSGYPPMARRRGSGGGARAVRLTNAATFTRPCDGCARRCARDLRRLGRRVPYRSGRARRQRGLDGFTSFRDSRLGHLAMVAVSCRSGPVRGDGGCLTLIALVRGRLRHAIVVAVVLVAANVTTQLLKPLATVSRPAEAPPRAPLVDGWPSGHMTAAMTLALCLVLVAPARLRPPRLPPEACSRSPRATGSGPGLALPERRGRRLCHRDGMAGAGRDGRRSRAAASAPERLAPAARAVAARRRGGAWSPSRRRR